jgi:hypothetical protein
MGVLRLLLFRPARVTFLGAALPAAGQGTGESGTMGKRDELIAQYAEDLRSKCGMNRTWTF